VENNIGYAILIVAVMAVVTYAIRVLPFLCFRKPIKSRFVKSVLYYVPYTVLIAMIFPSVLSVTGSFVTSLVGTVVAIIASLGKKSLMVVVALLAVLAVLATDGVMQLL